MIVVFSIISLYRYFSFIFSFFIIDSCIWVGGTPLKHLIQIKRYMTFESMAFQFAIYFFQYNSNFLFCFIYRLLNFVLFKTPQFIGTYLSMTQIYQILSSDSIFLNQNPSEIIFRSTFFRGLRVEQLEGL